MRENIYGRCPATGRVFIRAKLYSRVLLTVDPGLGPSFAAARKRGPKAQCLVYLMPSRPECP